MSKYFRTNDNFVFHRVGPGRHMVSISESFGGGGSGKKKGGGDSGRKKKSPDAKATKGDSTPKKGSASVGDRKNYYEKKGTKLQSEENIMLQKQVEGLEKQAEIRDKTLKKQERELHNLKVRLGEKNRELKEMQDEIRLLRKNDTKFANVDEESDESDGYLSDDFNMVEDEIEYTDFFRSKKCSLESPKQIKEIKKGLKNFFRVKCPGAHTVTVVVDEEKYNHLRKEEAGVFGGNVLIEEYNTFVDVLVKFSPDSKNECILTISMGS